MKKIFISLTVLLFLTTQIFSQNLSTTIKIQAMDMAKAVLNKDLDKLVTYMPAKLVADAGGKEKLMVARDTINKFMKQMGAEIKHVTIGEPGKIVSYKKQLQSVVPQTTELKFMASKVILETSLIAISEDNGVHWYFVDTTIYHGDKLKSSLPDLSPELVIPPMKQPKIIADEQ